MPRLQMLQGGLGLFRRRFVFVFWWIYFSNNESNFYMERVAAYQSLFRMTFFLEGVSR